MKINHGQTEDYNCAVFAIMFIFSLKGIPYKNWIEIEEELKPSKKNGTSHKMIMDYFDKKGLKYEISKNLNKSLLLVNYQFQGEGHYGVIVHRNNDLLWLFNPYNSIIEMMRERDFRELWYSKRYGKEWGLTLI